MSTITLTLGDMAENHIGMQKIGKMMNNGLTLNDLLEIRKYFNNVNAKNILFDLNSTLYTQDIFPDDEAYILIIKKGLDYLNLPYTSKDLYEEHINLEWDKKALMYGKVINKIARYNLCYGPKAQEPDYQSGKGRIISYENVPILKLVKDKICEIINVNKNKIVVEGNYYYDINKCGIGFHGDSERKIIIGIRLGAQIPLIYQWYLNGKSVGDKINIKLNDGDIYFMSEKATGNDWKNKNLYSLRHAAGAKKYIQ